MPKMSIRRLFVLVLVSILGAWSYISSSHAGQRFHYHGLLSGVPVFDLYLTLDLPGTDNGKYRILAEAVTIGSLATLYPYQAQAEATGLLKDGQVLPSQFVSQAKAYDKQNSLTLRFRPDGTLMNVPRWKGKIYDPLSALLVAMLGDSKFCEGKLPIYDGAARYDLTLASAGEQVFIAPERIGPFTLGSVEQCLANIEILSGADPNLVKLGLLPKQFRIGRHPQTQPAYLPLDNAFILGVGEIQLKLVE